MVICHGLDAIAFDVSFFIFHWWKINGIRHFFIAFVSLSKFIILDGVFPFNGLIIICIVNAEPKQGSLWCKSYKIKPLSKEVANCRQR